MPGTETYEYIATKRIMHGGVVAYQPGDPVPGDNVKEHGYLDTEAVVLRKDYKPENAAEEEAVYASAGAAMVRGEMPPNARTAPGEPEPEPAPAKSTSSSRAKTKASDES
jgi:hypothetical protein